MHLLPSVYVLMEFSQNKVFLTHTTCARMAEPELKAGHCSREATLELDPKLPQHLHSAKELEVGGSRSVMSDLVFSLIASSPP